MDARVLVEAQEAVGAEVDHPAVTDPDHPVGADLVDEKILEVAGRELLFEVPEVADQAGLAQDLGQPTHWKLHHCNPSRVPARAGR